MTEPTADIRCSCGAVARVRVSRCPTRLLCSCGIKYELDADGKPDRKPRARGLGDIVAGVTRRLGIRKCGGCKKRQKKLNDLFPFKGK